MIDYITVETTPIDEPCAQLGSENYQSNSLKEYHAMSEMLYRLFPNDKIIIKINHNNHDFGVYHDIKIVFNTENEESMKQAFNIENNYPLKWDAEALEYLKRSNYKLLNEEADPEFEDGGVYSRNV